ncbi:MAG: HepT-like ribonuclease domain-containing protein [Candidatus Bathyarchaeia archaeon]
MEIRAILSEALDCVRRARGIRPSSELEASALRWEIYAALQNTLDAMSMMVADLGLKKPGSYSELGLILCEEGFVNREIAEDVKSMAAVRNTLPHAYRRVSGEDLVKVVERLLPRVEAVADSLAKIAGEKGLDPKVRRHGLTGDQLKRLAETFRRREVLIAYLFGSRARGAFREDSDYDIAVLSEGGDVSVLLEAELAVEVADSLKVPVDKVDVVSLNKREFPLTARILKEGIIIYQRDEAFRRSWERKTYLELLRDMDLHAVHIKRRFRHTS